MGEGEKVVVDVPHRISGFFEIVDEDLQGNKIQDPLILGSRGAGFNLNAKGRTEIEFYETHEYKTLTYQININHETLNQKAQTTYYVYNTLKKNINIMGHVKISHYFDLPVGCGYGASGSGALGTAFGLNRLFKLNLSNHECGKIAHIAEVVNKTGLGTVCGQLGGGLCILKEPGYPCNSESIKIPPDLSVICGTFGKIETKSILSNPNLSRKIKNAGKIALTRLIQDPNIKTFMEASIDFVKKTRILEELKLKNTKSLMERLNELDILGASMNQLGRSVYAICSKKMKREVIDIFRSYLDSKIVYDLSIHEKSLKIKD